jgi:SAM-dependent MidA family methyltransferase
MQFNSKLPTPEPEKLAHSSKLVDKIIKKIATSGAITFTEFMNLALYDSEYGYYKSELKKLGADGDFITAPEISPLFSKCIAEQFIKLTSSVPNAAIFEFGAGSGKMAVDILLHLQAANKLPEKYFILEISPHLIKQQQSYITEKIPQLLPKIAWLSTLPANNSFTGMVVANEVLDAMPIQIFKIHADTIFEAYVKNNNDILQISWQDADPKLQQKVLALNITTSEAYISELNPMITSWLQAIYDFMHKGIVLLIDYGYEQSTYYHPTRSMGTLMCHLAHHAHGNPLIYPGIQDITAHVDFTAVANAAFNAGFTVINYMPQAYFLLENKLDQMLQNLPAADLIKQTQQVKQLILPNMMGEKFKTILLGKNINTASMQASDNVNKLYLL